MLTDPSTGKPVSDIVTAIQESYDEGVTDEFVKPIVVVDGEGKPLGTVQEGDVVVFINFRNDRAKELTITRIKATERRTASCAHSTCRDRWEAIDST